MNHSYTENQKSVSRLCSADSWRGQFYDVIIRPSLLSDYVFLFSPFCVQASFFIAYVVTSGWTSTSSELFRVIPFICSLVKRPFVKTNPDDELEVPSIPFHQDIPRILFFGLLGITYFFLAPLILPFLLIYLCLAYIIYRNQVFQTSLSHTTTEPLAAASIKHEFSAVLECVRTEVRDRREVLADRAQLDDLLARADACHCYRNLHAEEALLSIHTDFSSTSTHASI